MLHLSQFEMGASDRRRYSIGRALWVTTVVATLFLGPGLARAANIKVDTDALTITGDDGNPQSINGVPFRAVVEDGIARFYIAGNLTIGNTDTVTVVGSRPASLVVGGDLNINPNAVIDASAVGLKSGPGGGVSGITGAGGSGGLGGSGSYGGAGGSGGLGGSDNIDPTKIRTGQDGTGGESPPNSPPGQAGVTGSTGGTGGNGFGTTSGGGTGGAPGAGGQGGTPGDANPLGGQGGGGGPFGGVYNLAVGDVNGGPGNNPSQGGANGHDAPILSPEIGLPGSGGTNTGSGETLSGGSAGGAGGGGGGGGGGGAGEGGAGGGGGGGGGLLLPLVGGTGGQGGYGGAGGFGGTGGTGGVGGRGGAGGGGIEIVVYGTLTWTGAIYSRGGAGETVTNNGEDGEPGRPGSPGGNGSDGQHNYLDVQQYVNGGRGGNGSSGGQGGAGAKGADGGGGGGGAGGTVKVMASVIGPTAGALVDTRGGAGSSVTPNNDGSQGRFLFGDNVNAAFGGSVQGGPLDGITGPMLSNPHLVGDVPSPTIDNLTDGPAPYGLTDLTSASFSSVVSNAPTGAVAALVRLTVGPTPLDASYANYDMLFFINLSGTTLQGPRMGVGYESLARLRRGGFTRDPRFGGPGVEILTSIGPDQVYATLIPQGSADFNLAAMAGGQLRVASQQTLAVGTGLYLTDTSTVLTGGVLHVATTGSDPSAPFAGGDAWADSLSNLQRAMNRAANGDGLYPEVWVAEGSYAPAGSGTSDRKVSFQLVSGVAVYGGFAGTESTRDGRNPGLRPTIMTGDLNGDDVPSFTNNTENVYHVVEATGVDGTAVLDGFVIRSGNANEPGGTEGIPADVYNRGAGLYVDNGSPTIANCTFVYNFASDAGGGIYVVSGSPTFTNCRLRINQATNAGSGACIADGGSQWTNCVFTQNDATALGGGLVVEGGAPAFTGCQFTQHVDSTEGGGAAVNGGFASFTDCTFSGNSVTGDAGGVMVTADGATTLTNCTITGNSSPGRGGGLFIDSLSDGVQVFVTGGTIESNQAASGGGVLMESADITLDGATIQSNSATGNGGGILMEEAGGTGVAKINNSTIQNNNAGGTGGGLHVNGGASYEMRNTTIAQNTAASDGGGILNLGTATWTDCTVTGNTSSHNGGGVNTDTGKLTLTNCAIENNTGDTSGGTGGGVYSGASSTLEISGGDIQGNSLTGGTGGGLQIDGGTATLDGVTIQNNIAGGANGGAIDQGPGPLTMTACRVVGNQSGSNGGGLSKDADAQTNVDNCLFMANQATQSGGGIFIGVDTTNDIRNSRFLGNTTSASGGGGGIVWNGTGTIVNCVFSGNDTGTGGGIRADAGTLTLLNSTFAGNIVHQQNSALFATGTGLETVYNCIARGGPGSPFGGLQVNVGYSDVEGGYTGQGNIDQDPQFINANGADNKAGTEDDNLRLMPTSPCIDAGYNDPITNVAANDLDFNLRRADVAAVPDTGRGLRPIVDMGAYEVYGTAIMPTMFVDASAAEGTPGVSADLQAVLVAAGTRGGEAIKTIRVAQGTYRPTVPNGDRTVSFNIPSGVQLFGGFPPGATSSADQDPTRYPTILSGDLNGDDASGGSNAENSYHVVTAILCDDTTLLDGFIIEGGNANGISGGGMLLNGSSLGIYDCTFRNNQAGNGGGVFNSFDSSSVPCCPEVMPVYMNCRFLTNSATSNGAGTYDGNASHAYYEECEFEGNVAGTQGGGSYATGGGMLVVFKNCTWTNNTSLTGAGFMLDAAHVEVHDCILRANTANESGGGFRAINSGLLMTNTLIVGNAAVARGGAIDDSNSDLRILHCTVVENTAPANPAVNIGSNNNRIDFVNSIFWANSDPTTSGTIDVPPYVNLTLYKNCLIQLPPSYDPKTAPIPLDLNPQHYVNTIGSDPLFRDMLGPDGQPGTGDEDLRLKSGSPALDSGTTDLSDLENAGVYTTVLPEFDIVGAPRISGPLPDRGAYEAQPGIVVSPLSGLDFGEIAITAGNSAPLGVTIKNTGYGNLSFTEGSLSFVGDDPTEFHFDGVPNTGPIAQNESRVFQLQFNPSTIGVRTAFLQINTDDPTNPSIRVPLQGEGALTGLTGVTTRQVRDMLLGITHDPTNLDVNGDGTIDIGDVIRNEISINNGGF